MYVNDIFEVVNITALMMNSYAGDDIKNEGGVT